MKKIFTFPLDTTTPKTIITPNDRANMNLRETPQDRLATLRDRADRGRCRLHKLGRLKANELRAEFAKGGITKSQLSRKFNVSHGYVSELISGKYWP